MDRKKSSLIWSIVIKAIVVVGAVVGLTATFVITEIGAKNEILYYTVQSNIWIAATMLVFLILEIVALCKGREWLVPNWLRLLKFVFTVAITVTGVVYNFVLFPASLGTPDPTNPLALSSFFTHIVVPVFSVLDFVLFDYVLKTNKWSFLLGATTLLYYFPFSMVAAQLGSSFKNGAKFPYFFLDYEKHSWFGFEGMPGVFWWLWIVLGVVLGISVILLLIKNKRAKKKGL